MERNEAVGPLLKSAGLWVLLSFALVLNTWANDWGLPGRWHGDELSRTAADLLEARDLNPHYFMYGNIAFYRTMLGVAPALAYTRLFDPEPAVRGTAEHAAWSHRHERRIMHLPRYQSAVEGVLVVLVTYLIGSLVAGQMVGLLAGALVALSPVMVYIGHIATADGFANLATWLALLAGLLGWRRRDRRWLAAAALLTGIAIGTKLDRGLLLFPLATALAFAGELRQRRGYLLLLLLPVAGYLLANPVLLVSPFEFLDGVTRDMAYAAIHEEDSPRSYTTLLWYLRDGTGWPIFMVAVAGLAWGGWLLAVGRQRREVVWLFSTFLPYYVVFGSREVYPWYVGQLLPGLLVLGAWAVVRGLDVATHWLMPAARRAFATRAAIAALLLVAFLYPLSVLLQFQNDARITAGEWIERNVPAGATLFITARGPEVPREQYELVRMMSDRERWGHVTEPIVQIEQNDVYQKIRRTILDAESWAGRTFGFPVREKPYQGWFDVVVEDLESRPVASVQTQQVLPDYVVIVQGMQPTVLAWLRTPESGYRQVARFQYQSLFGRNVIMPMLNHSVWIFERSHAAEGGFTGGESDESRA